MKYSVSGGVVGWPTVHGMSGPVRGGKTEDSARIDPSFNVSRLSRPSGNSTRECGWLRWYIVK